MPFGEIDWSVDGGGTVKAGVVDISGVVALFEGVSLPLVLGVAPPSTAPDGAVPLTELGVGVFESWLGAMPVSGGAELFWVPLPGFMFGPVPPTAFGVGVFESWFGAVPVPGCCMITELDVVAPLGSPS